MSRAAAGTEDWLAAHRLEHATWNPNWPVHAAKTLGGPDPLDLLPKTYAWWLRRREEVRTLYPTGNKTP